MTPPSSPWKRSSSGGAPKDASAMPRRRTCSSWPDSGGSNGSRCRLWKYALQEKLVDPYQLSVTVCHYPTGASKWNPIEHRLFSEISKHWAGKPLDNYQTIINYAQTTCT